MTEKTTTKNGLLKTFVTGLMALMPLVLTFIILQWLALKITYLIGPTSFFGAALQNGVSFITGANHQILAYLIGLLLTIVAIYALGLYIQARLKFSLRPFIDRFFSSLPVVGGIYRPISQVIKMVENNSDPELKSMTVVSCEYAGVDCLGLLTSQKIYMVDGQPRKMVFLPQAPIPMTGSLALVPAEKIMPMPNMSVEELLQTFVSLGLVSSDEANGTVPIKH